MRRLLDEPIYQRSLALLIITFSGAVIIVSSVMRDASSVPISLLMIVLGVSMLAQTPKARAGLAGRMKMLESALLEMKSWNVAPENKQERYEAIFFSAGNNLPQAISTLRTIYDLTLEQANMLAEATVPWIIVRGVSQNEAEYIRTKLAAAGAEVEIAKDIS